MGNDTKEDDRCWAPVTFHVMFSIQSHSWLSCNLRHADETRHAKSAISCLFTKVNREKRVLSGQISKVWHKIQTSKMGWVSCDCDGPSHRVPPFLKQVSSSSGGNSISLRVKCEGKEVVVISSHLKSCAQHRGSKAFFGQRRTVSRHAWTKEPL